MSIDCRDSPWGWAGEGGHCDLGVCAPRGNSSGEGSGLAEAGAAWACACDEGWARFPAVGAAPRCTVNPTAVMAFAAIQVTASVPIITIAIRKLRSNKRMHAALNIATGLSCLIAAALQTASLTRLSVGDSEAVFVLKMTAGLLVDVSTRLLIQNYRAAALARVVRRVVITKGSSLPSLDEIERVAAARTRAEITASVGIFVVYVCAATGWSASTRVAAAAFYLYWCFAPASVWISTRRVMREHLEELEQIESLALEGAVDLDMTRFSLAKARARKLRTFIAWGYGFVMTVSATSLALLPYVDQFHWFVGDINFSTGYTFFAGTSLSMLRNSRSRKVAVLQSSVKFKSTVLKASGKFNSSSVIRDD
jgi:hypothetical protein